MLSISSSPELSTAVLAAGSSGVGHFFGQLFSWLLALVIVAAALGMVLCRKLIHSALSLLLVMVGMALEYAILNAPFVFVVQIVVYAGAIMVMFLFIVMMVGADADAEEGDPIRGQRVAAIVMSVAVVVLAGIAIWSVTWPEPANFDETLRSTGGNISGLGDLIFNKYVIIFEVLSALLIIAAVGAIVLTLRTRVKNRPTQRETMEARFRAYAEKGTYVGAMPGAGVYASSNAMDVPALLPDGSELRSSISEEIYDAHEERSGQELAAHTAKNYEALDTTSREDD